MDMIVFTDGLMLIECTVLTFLLKISYFLFRHPDLFPIHCSPPCRFDCYLRRQMLLLKNGIKFLLCLLVILTAHLMYVSISSWHIWLEQNYVQQVFCYATAMWTHKYSLVICYKLVMCHGSVVQLGHLKFLIWYLLWRMCVPFWYVADIFISAVLFSSFLWEQSAIYKFLTTMKVEWGILPPVMNACCFRQAN